MLSKKGFFLLLFTFITQISLFSRIFAMGMVVEIKPYTLVSHDGKYIFVMLRGAYYGRCVPDKELLIKYPQDGLYLNDGSSTLLWPVKWWYNAQVILPSDGIHLIRLGPGILWPWEGRNYDHEAFSFFKYGKLIRTYKINDLIFLPCLLDRSSSQSFWKCKISVEKNNVLNVSTRQGDKYIFDITTGKIISSHRFLKPTVIIIMILFLILYLFYLYFTIKKKRGDVLKILKSSIIKVLIASLTLTIMTFLLLELYLKTVEIGYICHVSQPQMLLHVFSLFLFYLPFDLSVIIFGRYWFIGSRYLEQIIFVFMIWFIIFTFLQIMNILIANFLRIIKTFFTKKR